MKISNATVTSKQNSLKNIEILFDEKSLYSKLFIKK